MRYNGGQGSNAKDREREDSTPFDEVNFKKTEHSWSGTDTYGGIGGKGRDCEMPTRDHVIHKHT